jgi:flagellar hook-basal body complex protein FliE
MALSGITAISGLGSLGSIGSIGAPGSIGSSPGRARSTDVGGSVSLGFSDALERVQKSIDQADGLAQQLATGELTDIHEYTVAASKAQLGVQLTVAMRNQLLSAFQEVMRTQL